MDGSRIRALIVACPFKPFILHMENGRHYNVSRPSDLAISPKLDQLIVATVGEQVEFLNVSQVKDVVISPMAASA